MIHKVRWNNAVVTSNVSYSFTRSDQAIADDGTTLSSNVPRYTGIRLLCPAPDVTLAASAHKRPRVWGGRWLDASPCLVEKWFSPSTSDTTVGIAVSTYPPSDSSREASDSDSILVSAGGYNHVPQSFIVADGAILAFCTAFSSSSGLPVAVSICYWKETVVGGSSSTKVWAFWYVGPEVQTTPRELRGRDWMATGPWVPPGGVDSEGKIIEFFVAWTDYRANAGSQGGQLFIMRCWRINSSSLWNLDEVAFLYSDTFWPSLLTDINMHFHTAAVTFPGGMEEPSMVVTLSVGDSWPNNRLVNISRDDFADYSIGSDEPRAATPSPVDEVPPDMPTGPQNGWLTYEDREGQRNRIQFTNATYASTTLTSSAFANFTASTAGVTPLVITSGITGDLPRVVGIISASSSAVGLNQSLTPSGGGSQINGYLWSDESVQGMWQAPGMVRSSDTSPWFVDRKTVIFGGDEQGNAIYRYTINDPGERINLAIVHGVMTNTATDYTAGNDRNLGWLTFLGAFRTGYASGDMIITDYAAHVAPNSHDPWSKEPRAITIFYSPDGNVWGEMFAPSFPRPTPSLGVDFQVPSAFFGAESFFLGRPDDTGLHSIPKPRASGETARYLMARPLSISGGGRNLRRRAQTTSSVETIEVESGAGPQAPNSLVAVSRSLFDSSDPTYGSILKPPCIGPIMRCTFVDSSFMGIWNLTQDFPFDDLPRARMRLWLYVMPGVINPTDPDEMPTCTAASLSFILSATRSGHSFFDSTTVYSTLLEVPSMAGGGWTPITLYFDAGTIGGTSPPTYFLQAKVSSGTQTYQRQDVLLAVDFVVASDGQTDLPVRSLIQPNYPDQSTVLSQNEKFNVNFLMAGGSQSPTWSVFAAFRIPDPGADVFTQSRAVDPTSLTVFTLRESATKYLRIVLDRADPNDTDIAAPCRLFIIDHTGAQWPIAGPAAGDDGIGFEQPFYFLRGRQVLFGIARYYNETAAAYRYRAWVSVGGTRVKVADSEDDLGSEDALAGVLPINIRSGDINSANIDPTEFFGFWADDTNALSVADGRAKLHDPVLFLS